MEQPSYNIKAELPNLVDGSRKILGLYKLFWLSVHSFSNARQTKWTVVEYDTENCTIIFTETLT